MLGVTQQIPKSDGTIVKFEIVKKGSKSWGGSAAKTQIVVPVISALNIGINAFILFDLSEPLPENHAQNCLRTRGETRSCCVLFGNGYERFMGSSND